MYDSCVMSMFTREVVENVYVEFRSNLNRLRTFSSFYFILYCVVFYIVLHVFVSLPLANKDAYVNHHIQFFCF